MLDADKKLVLKPAHHEKMERSTLELRWNHHLTRDWTSTSQYWVLVQDDEVVGDAIVVVCGPLVGVGAHCNCVVRLSDRVEVITAPGIKQALTRMGYSNTEVA